MTIQNARTALAKNLHIPTLPSVVQRISAMLDDPRAGAKEIGDVVAQDAPLSAKVLKIANSSYYGLRERCIAVQQAAAVLGVRVLRNVVLQASVIKQYEHLRAVDFDIDELWRHSILVGQGASFLARQAKARFGLTPDELYMCGLLHDLGQVVLLDSLGQAYVEIARHAKYQKVSVDKVEQASLGYDHADVGYLVADKWGLHPALASAVQLHHAHGPELEKDRAASWVSAVNHLVHHVCEGNRTAAAEAFDARRMKLFAVGAEHVSALVEFVETAMSSTEV